MMKECRSTGTPACESRDGLDGELQEIQETEQ